VVVHDNARDIRQQLAAPGAHAIERQQGGRRHVQPLRFAADTKAGLVHVLDRRPRYEIAHGLAKSLQTVGATAAHSGDGRGGELDAEQIGHQLGEAGLGQQLVVQQIDHEGRDPRAILHGRVDAFGKRTPRLRAASGAPANGRAVLGDDEGPRLGQVEHLTRRVILGHVRRQRRAAFRATGRKMIDARIWFGDLPQGFALVAFLPARLFIRLLAQAHHPRRFLQAIARWRLAAVGTVQSELALEFGDPRLQCRDLGRLRPDQRNQFFPGRLARRFANHLTLESKADSPVH
jgi:hypothetical protein